MISEGLKLTVITEKADILGDPTEPHTITENDSQLLYGEQFYVEKSHGAYVYGHSVLDGYKGYVERDQLIKDASPATVFIIVRASHIYPEPTFKSRPRQALSFLSRLTAENKTEGGFTQLEDGDWIYTKHIAPIDSFKMKGGLADTANLFLNAPYVYGGRSTRGVDCSGLIQQSIIAQGYDCPPRDTVDQEGKIGKEIKKEDLKRNDIVYFKGHVGIMIDDENIINATARHMSTVIEKIETLENVYGGVTHICRL